MNMSWQVSKTVVLEDFTNYRFSGYAGISHKIVESNISFWILLKEVNRPREIYTMFSVSTVENILTVGIVIWLEIIDI